MTSGLAIGEPGSGSNAIVQEVVKSNRPEAIAAYKFLEWPYLKSVDALMKGEIQALAVVDGIESPIIQKLLATPNINIANFPLAPAYVKRLPQLDLVSIPRGSFSGNPIFPASDINMVSTTLSLVVEKNLHPALQLLFLMAMDHLGDSRDQFFSKQDEFPAYKDSNVPLAPIAKQYFTNGAPIALNYVGFRLASLSHRIWFFILSALAIVYPLYRLIPNFRSTLGDVKISDAQDMLYDLQNRFAQAETIEEFDIAMHDFIQFQKEVDALLPRISVSHYYQVVRPIEYVKKISQECHERICRTQNITQAKSET
jgi:ABC-type antimicrobial peptide transport system permease subunit